MIGGVWSYVILSVLLAGGGCAIYHKIGRDAINKEDARRYSKKLKKLKEKREEAAIDNKKVLKRAAQNPTRGSKVTPQESVDNLLENLKK